MREPLPPIPLEAIEAAAERLAGHPEFGVIRTPLLPLSLERPGLEVYLKLENLQPIGSFKLRGAGNAMALAQDQDQAQDQAQVQAKAHDQAPGEELLARGVYTASAGNMAQGVAWNARRLGVPCRVIVPDHAPAAKVDAIRRLGGEVVPVPFDDWWQVIVEHEYPGEEGFFIHPVSDPAVIAGNGTIGLEIAAQLPEVDAVLVPYGGGGLSCGIASALVALKPGVPVYGCEVATAAPLAAAWAAGEPVSVEYTPSFVDGIGSKRVLEEMWPLVRQRLAGSRVVPLVAVEEAVRLLAERARVIAEGAGATAVAAALAGQREGLPPLRGKVVCVVSGGNLDLSKLSSILEHESRVH